MEGSRWALRVRALGLGLLLLPVPGLAIPLDPLALEEGDVGSPTRGGTLTNRAGVIRISAGGAGIGLKADEFHFAAARESGDFDVQVRVTELRHTDLWAKAGLMLRRDRTATAPFAGVFTTPSGIGCLFQSRETAGATAVPQGFFPANQPFTWLRLRREGDILTGFAGLDGRRWTRLGSGTVAFGTEALLGYAVASHGSDASAATVAEFREAGPVLSPLDGSPRAPIEPLGPSNRRGAIVISEIMYHPADRADAKDLEFVEIYNSQPYFEDLGGWRLTGEMEYTFPPGTTLPGCGFLVVAAAPPDLEGLPPGATVLGPYQGRLSNGGGTLRLVGPHQAVFFEVEYGTEGAWSRGADGAGHSLVLARPSYGEGNPSAWTMSRLKGGSPGAPEAVEITSTSGVRFNEILLPTNDGGGFVELFNASPDEADLEGLRLGTAPDSLPFRIPAGTKLPPSGFVKFVWSDLGFTPDPTGDELYLDSADGTRVVDACRVTPQVPGQPCGRWPNGGAIWRPLVRPTPGAPNARPAAAVVISEVHPTPISGNPDEEFLELHNPGSAAVDIGDWRLESGVEFTFPVGASVRAGGYLVVARDATHLRQIRPDLTPDLVVGDFQGRLSGSGERVVLQRPVAVRDPRSGELKTCYAEVTAATFAASGRWTRWADGGGSTLELADLRADPDLPANWSDSDEAARGAWTTVEATGVLDNTPATGGGGGGGGGFPGGGGGGGPSAVTPDGLQIILLGEGEVLIDNVEVIGPGNTNSDPTLARWFASGSPLRRRLLAAYHQLATGPMEAAAVAPLLDAKYAAFQEHGITAQAPTAIKSYLATARTCGRTRRHGYLPRRALIRAAARLGLRRGAMRGAALVRVGPPRERGT